MTNTYATQAGDERILVVDAAASELELVVEEEKARRFAGLDSERSEGAAFGVELQHAAEVDGADDVDVVKDERLIGISGSVGVLIAV